MMERTHAYLPRNISESILHYTTLAESCSLLHECPLPHLFLAFCDKVGK